MTSTTTWMVLIGLATKIVLGLLVVLSIWSFAVMLDRRKALKGSVKSGELERLKAIIHSSSKTPAPLVATPMASLTVLEKTFSLLKSSPQNPETIAYALKSMLSDERTKLSKGLPILATLGSNAPFIGLFGTVLGIIQSFGTLAGGAGDMNQVITNLAEALIATAVGLFVAIPAVIAYNTFSQRLKQIFGEAESLRDYYLAHRVFGVNAVGER